MRKSAFITICRMRTSVEAERLIGLLRKAGLHPTDLALSAPCAVADEHLTFPVEVPCDEAGAARQILHLS